MKTQTVADEYWAVAMSLSELAARLKFLSRIDGTVAVDDIAEDMRGVSSRLVRGAQLQEEKARIERLAR